MNDSWIVLAFVCAFSLATSDALTKKVVIRENELLIAWLRLFLTLPFLVIYLLFSHLPHINPAFVIAYCTALPLQVLATVLYIKALRISPLSMTLPFQSLTPLFLIFFSRIITGERVTGSGAAGIGLIVIGGYILNIESVRRGFVAPVKAIVRERGTVYMILVALIYSVTSPLEKFAVRHSSPAFFVATYYLGVVLCLLPFVALKAQRDFKTVLRQNIRPTVLPGIFLAMMAITHYAALNLGHIAYVIAIKRSSILIGSLYGFLFFGERQVGGRLTGALLMFAGFVLIVMSTS